MKVAHEHRRKSADKWMRCRGRFEMISGHRDEELEDVNDEDEEDMNFEFETSSKTSKCSKMMVNNFLILLFVMFSTSFGKKTIKNYE